MAYDPYKTYAAGSITSSLIAAQEALEAAQTQSLGLDPTGAMRSAIGVATEEVRRLRKVDLWEASR